MTRTAAILIAAARPLTPRFADFCVLWAAMIIGIAAFLLNVGFFGA